MGYWYRGKPCTCPAKVGLCNLTFCQEPWAQGYRRSVAPRWYERVVGVIIALFTGRWRL